jgi:integrase
MLRCRLLRATRVRFLRALCVPVASLDEEADAPLVLEDERGRPRPLGAPLYVVRDALGHASIATTQVYLSRVGAHEAVYAMRNREWLMP